MGGTDTSWKNRGNKIRKLGESVNRRIKQRKINRGRKEGENVTRRKKRVLRKKNGGEKGAAT